VPGVAEWRSLSGTDVALTAATTKTVLTVTAGAGRVVLITELGVGFDDTVATREAILVELCKFDVTSAGTGSAAVTPAQIRGPAVTRAHTAARNYTTEPTVLTPIREWLVEPKSGLVLIQLPLGREPVSDVAKGFAIRCTAPNAVNARAYLSIEE
jgi:hypothetical protein